jgi:hypothetical protein
MEHFEDWYVSAYTGGEFDKLDAAIQAFIKVCLSIIIESAAREGIRLYMQQDIQD